MSNLGPTPLPIVFMSNYNKRLGWSKDKTFKWAGATEPTRDLLTNGIEES